MRLHYDVKEDQSDLVLARIYLRGVGDEVCVCGGGEGSCDGGRYFVSPVESGGQSLAAGWMSGLAGISVLVGNYQIVIL